MARPGKLMFSPFLLLDSYRTQEGMFCWKLHVGRKQPLQRSFLSLSKHVEITTMSGLSYLQILLLTVFMFPCLMTPVVI